MFLLSSKVILGGAGTSRGVAGDALAAEELPGLHSVICAMAKFPHLPGDTNALCFAADVGEALAFVVFRRHDDELGLPANILMRRGISWGVTMNQIQAKQNGKCALFQHDRLPRQHICKIKLIQRQLP